MSVDTQIRPNRNECVSRVAAFKNFRLEKQVESLY
jgi:hypothetical protein